MVEPPIISKITHPGKKETSQSRLFALLDNRWAVLGVIFFAMMFLGLPLLWRCPGFSRIEKLVWTVIVLVYSALILWLFYLVMAWCYRQIIESLN